MNVQQAIADAIVTQGTDTIFGLAGDANMLLIADLMHRHGVRFVAARNENAAVMMADAYFRTTGRTAVATVTHGPALAVAGSALTIARQAHSSLVLIAGDTPPGDPLHPQSFDQQPFTLATAGTFVPVAGAATAMRDVALAYRAARDMPGPVVLDIAADLLEEQVPVASREPVPVPAFRPARPLVPNEEDVLELAQRLHAARRPVLLAGRGAEHAATEIAALADRAGALLATTLMASGLFADRPHNLGVAGGLARPLTRRVLGEADLIVSFGAGLNRWTVDHGGLFPAATVVSVDTDPAAIGAKWPVDAGVTGDAAETALALSAALASQSRPQWRTPELLAELRSAEPFEGVVFQTTEDRIDPRTFIRVCNERLPLRRTTIVGVGHFGGWPNLYLDTVATDRSFLAPWDFGSIGVGLPYAIGAAIGRPDRPVVIFEGDGSLLTGLGELDTLARLDVAVLLVVLDDSAYGAEVRKLDARRVNADFVRFPDRDLAELARVFGIPAWTVASEDEARAALDAALPIAGPRLIHVKVMPDVMQEKF